MLEEIGSRGNGAELDHQYIGRHEDLSDSDKFHWCASGESGMLEQN